MAAPQFEHSQIDWAAVDFYKEFFKTQEWADTEKEDHTKILDMFASYRRQRKNKRIARHHSKQRMHCQSESFDHFVKDFSLLLMDCEYADADDMLVDALIAASCKRVAWQRWGSDTC